MIDNFAVFGIERRPAIDENFLQAVYLRKSQELHPDRAGENDFSAINATFQCLLNPVQRTQHLIKLEFGDTAPSCIGTDLGELFGRIAALVRWADEETVSIAAQDSPLLRAMTFQRLGPLLENLMALDTELSEKRQNLLRQIEALDQRWMVSRSECRDPLAQVAVDLTFIQKWSTQIRERILKLEELV
jgi:DnaJ-domain-containing protein 1